jgi:hypothetical protein
MHLTYNLMTAGMDCNENRHAQIVMKELGITYQHATPQSLYDCWWFWNCENVPAKLPKYLRPLTLDPLTQVGNGLSQADAEKIARGDVGAAQL